MNKALQQQYLAAMEIQAWELRDVTADAGNRIQDTGEKPVTMEPVRGDVHALGWEALEACVAGCTACELHAARTQTVFGVGDRRARLMVVGEAPGADEDRQGEPFVGRAGQLLNEMLRAMGFAREQVYIANILKCRPPDNRDPLPAEVASCEAYLKRQIELVQPALILALGRVAAQNLLKTQASLARLRGKCHTFNAGEGHGEIPVVVTFHPAYLLRAPKEKRSVWEDLQYAMDILAQQSIST